MKIKQRNKYCLFFLFVLLSQIIFSQNEIPISVSKIIDKAFLQKTPYQICLSLEKNIETLKNTKEKIMALSILADYEERNEFYERATDHCLKIAELSNYEGKKSALIKAVGNALLAGKTSQAHSIYVSSIIPLIKNITDDKDIKALVYFEWIKLKLFENENYNYSLNEITTTLTKYVTNAKFTQFHPSILLTLWWLNNDKKAENTLLKKYPNSIEAGIVKGSVTLSPKTFWYLMPRNTYTEEESPTVADSAKSTEQTPITRTENVAQSYQVGFFKNIENAKRMSAKLTEKGFTSIIKKENKNNENFYSVVVKVDNKGDIILRLKNEGYEAVPIF